MIIIITTALSRMSAANADPTAVAGGIVAGTSAISFVACNGNSRIGIKGTLHGVLKIQLHGFAGKSGLAHEQSQCCGQEQ